MVRMWWHVAVAVAGASLFVWVALVLALYLAGRKSTEPATVRDALRIVPDVIRLLRRLAVDPTLPRGVRLRLALLVGYLICPIDLIPDFVPAIGYADDAIVVVWALRSVTRAAGIEAIERHWPGTPEGLSVLRRLAHV
jgi:uncharacterized membrane protein YkvA (DUF1232 family)